LQFPPSAPRQRGFFVSAGLFFLRDLRPKIFDVVADISSPRYTRSMRAKKFCAVVLGVAFIALSVAAPALLAQHGTEPTAAPATASNQLTLLSGDHKSFVSAAELKAMPHTTVTIHNLHSNADETYSGVRLADLLAKLGAPLGSELHGKALASYIVATGSDGYKAVLALGEVDPGFHPGEVLVADAMDGKPLGAHSGPFKLVVTEDKRPARSVRNLVSIELKSAN